MLYREISAYPRTQYDESFEYYKDMPVKVSLGDMEGASFRYPSRVGEDDHRKEEQTADYAVQEEYGNYRILLERLLLEYVIKTQQAS
jgi:hypothetical protein